VKLNILSKKIIAQIKDLLHAYFVGLLNMLSLINNIIPKNQNKILFISTPDFSDNSKYLFNDIIKEEHFKNYIYLWILKTKTNIKNKPRNTIFIKQYSLNWLINILTCKFIICTHGVPLWKSKNQFSILLWHGIPLKKIGYYTNSLDLHTTLGLKLLNSKVDLLITTSEFTSELFMHIFNIDIHKIKDYGYPRNDVRKKYQLT